MKILIITQHIFPIQTPRAHRSTELAIELARLNHDVTIFAVLGKYNYSSFEKKTGIKVKKIPIRFEIRPYTSDGVKKRNFIDKVLAKVLGKIFEFPNIEFKYRIKKILKGEKNIDLLISIANPHQIHWGCATAKKELNEYFPKIWIADCGDPFMKNNSTNKHFKRFEKEERLFCRMCDHITVPFNGAIKSYYPDFRKKISVIPQGFQFDINRKFNVPKNRILTFAYSGTFLKNIRNPTKFLEYLIDVKLDFIFYIYTPYTELIQSFKKKLGHKLIIKKPIPRTELIKNLEKMDFLVNIENNNASSQLPSKLIDYAICGRPILSVNPVSPNKKIINQFLNKNFTNQLEIDNIEKYHISNVARSFLKLKQ